MSLSFISEASLSNIVSSRPAGNNQTLSLSQLQHPHQNKQKIRLHLDVNWVEVYTPS